MIYLLGCTQVSETKPDMLVLPNETTGQVDYTMRLIFIAICIKQNEPLLIIPGNLLPVVTWPSYIILSLRI